MWWILAIIGGAVIFLLWPTRNRRSRAHVLAAKRALDARNWPTFDQQLALARTAAAQLRDSRILHHDSGQVDLMTAEAHYWRGNPDEALTCLASAVEHIETAGAPDRSFNLLTARHVWGNICFDAGQLDQAEVQFRTACEIAEHSGNPPIAIFTLQRLGDVLLEKREFAAAKVVIERCIEMERAILNSIPNASGKAQISMTFPDLCLANQDFVRAEELFREKVNHWWKMVTKPDNIDVTRYQFHLAEAQREQGHLQAAAETLKMACDTAQRDFGATHPRTLRAHRKLAELQEIIAHQPLSAA